MFPALILAVAIAVQAPPEAGSLPGTSPQAAEDEEIIVPGEKQNRLWLEGLEAFKAGRYSEAEEKLYTLESRVETGARVEALLFGEVTSQLNKRSPLENFIFTVDHVPDEGAAIVYVRGIAQARQGKLGAAAGAMREALRINSKFFDAYVDLALIQILRGRQGLARRQLRPIAKLLSKCNYNCAEKQARYERVKELVSEGASAKP